MSTPLLSLTELPGSLDVNVVVAAADADNNAECLELLQVLSSQGDGVVHHGPDCLIQHLRDIRDSLYYVFNGFLTMLYTSNLWQPSFEMQPLCFECFLKPLFSLF